MKGREDREQLILKKNEILLKNEPDIVKNWYMFLMASGKAARTLEEYIRTVIRFEDRALSEKINSSNITLDVASRYMSSLSMIPGMSDSYKQTTWNVLNELFKYLKVAGIISENYMIYIQKPKNKDLERIKKNRKKIEKNNLKEIIDGIEYEIDSEDNFKRKCILKRNKLIFMVLMSTGMRCSALLDINLKDIDFINKIIYVEDKNDETIQYPINQKTYDALLDWMSVRYVFSNRNSNALFISQNGERMHNNSLSKMTKKYTKQYIGIELSPHKFRGAFCSILYEEKGNIEFVRRAVHHSNITTTERYIVTNNKETEEASKVFNGIF